MILENTSIRDTGNEFQCDPSIITIIILLPTTLICWWSLCSKLAVSCCAHESLVHSTFSYVLTPVCILFTSHFSFWCTIDITLSLSILIRSLALLIYKAGQSHLISKRIQQIIYTICYVSMLCIQSTLSQGWKVPLYYTYFSVFFVPLILVCSVFALSQIPI